MSTATSLSYEIKLKRWKVSSKFKAVFRLHESDIHCDPVVLRRCLNNYQLKFWNKTTSSLFLGASNSWFMFRTWHLAAHVHDLCSNVPRKCVVADLLCNYATKCLVLLLNLQCWVSFCLFLLSTSDLTTEQMKQNGSCTAGHKYADIRIY